MTEQIVPPVVPPVVPPAVPPTAGDQTPGPVPYERFKEVNDRLKVIEAAQTKVEADRKAAADKALADQAKWQQLAEQRDIELKAEKLARLRLQVAASKGLPAALAERLQGNDEAAIAKDADVILAQIEAAAKGGAGPGVPPATRGGGPTRIDLSKMTPEQIRAKTTELLAQAG